MVPAWAGFVARAARAAITIAASVARDAYDQRYSVGLLSNSSVAGRRPSVRILPGRRAEQFMRVLEALAVITPFVLEPLAAMLDREEHRLTAGTTLAVVTSLMTDDLAATLLRLRRRGHQVVVLSVAGELWAGGLGQTPVLDVSHLGRPAEEAPV